MRKYIYGITLIAMLGSIAIIWRQNQIIKNMRVEVAIQENHIDALNQARENDNKNILELKARLRDVQNRRGEINAQLQNPDIIDYFSIPIPEGLRDATTKYLH